MQLTLYSLNNLGELNVSNNRIYDNMDSFLGANANVLAIKTIQYIQSMSLYLSIKLDLSEKYGLNGAPHNYYVKITLSDSEKLSGGLQFYYYFVDSIRWRANQTCEFSLYMDTLNTFNKKWAFDKRTKVIREHKDRFVNLINTLVSPVNNLDKLKGTYLYLSQNEETKYSKIYCSDIIQEENTLYLNLWDKNQPIEITAGSYTCRNENGIQLTLIVQGNIKTNTLIRNIDYYSEGFETTLYKQIEKNIELDGFNWFLVYMATDDITQTTTNPIRTFLMRNKDFYYRYSQRNVLKLWASNLEQGKYYYITDNLDVLALDSGKFNSPTTKHYIQISIDSDNPSLVSVKYIEYNRNVVAIRSDEVNLYKKYGNLGESVNYIETNVDVFENFPNPTDLIPNIPTESITATGQFQTTAIDSSYTYLAEGLDRLDKTNSKIMKIIQLPYCPFNFQLVKTPQYEYYVVDVVDDIKTGQISIDDVQHDYLEMEYTRGFENHIEEISPIDYFILNRQDFRNGSFVKVMDRDDKYESKLYHSDYNYFKLVYDSFAFAIQNEYLDISHYLDFIDKFKIKYNITSTINSRFLFTFESYITDKFQVEDYNNILNVARNNEVSIYNIDYINYLRNGYNYDVKTKERQDVSAWLGLGLQGLSSITSYATSLQGANLPNAIIGGLQTASSMVSNVVGTIQGVAQREQNLEAKITQLKAQSGSIQGADDVDLMTIYSDNRMKWIKYDLSTKMKKVIGDLFYYFGYSVNEQKIPNTDSRSWFNFVQCELVFDTEYNKYINMSEEIKNDIVNRYANGVTYFHYTNTDSTHKRYDTTQVLENIETKFIGGF